MTWSCFAGFDRRHVRVQMPGIVTDEFRSVLATQGAHPVAAIPGLRYHRVTVSTSTAPSRSLSSSQDASAASRSGNLSDAARSVWPAAQEVMP